MSQSRQAGSIDRRLLLLGAGAALLARGTAFSQPRRPLPRGFSAFKGPPTDFFENEINGERLISIRSRGDGGIVRYPIELLLQPGARLKWEWRVNALPSEVAETTAQTHDYSSIAVEFDDGQDLSYFWSAVLPIGDHFGCPLPGWSTETHYVVRTGSEQLGKWLPEEREILQDVAAALKRRPRKIVAVWLIAYTVPHRRLASTDFRRISVVRPSETERVIFPA